MTVYGSIKKVTGNSMKVIILGIILSLGGCSMFGGGGTTKVKAAEEIFKIGVNAYLWQASLDTLSFMPIRSANQNSGVILTEWEVDPYNKKQRSKVDVIITGKRLTTESLTVTVHRQKYTAMGWQDIDPRPGAAINISKAILMQARILRRNNAPIK